MSDDMLRTLKRAGLQRSRARRRSSAPTKRRFASTRSSTARGRRTSGSIRARRSSNRSRLTCTARYETGVRGRSDTAAEGRDPRQRAEPDRPGYRVRLLLLPCGVRAARGGVRDRHGQLQPRDGVDRLRHGRSAVLRAADVRRRLGDHHARAGSRRRRRPASSSTAGRRR